jgi:hypothetical protein
VIVREYCLLRNRCESELLCEQEDSINFSGGVPMSAFFDNIKSNLLALWEREIVRKGFDRTYD